MDKIAISEVINRQRNLRVEDIDMLKSLADKYPFSELFSILYLKALSQSKSLDFDSVLPNYAYRISDRKRLFEIIHSDNVTEEVNTSKTVQLVDDELNASSIDKPIESVAAVEKEETSFAFDLPSQKEEVATEKDEKEFIEDEKQDEIVETEAAVDVKILNQNIVEQNIPETVEKSEQPIEEPKDTSSLNDELEQNILMNVVDNLYPSILESQSKDEPQNETEREEDSAEASDSKENIHGIDIERPFISWLVQKVDFSEDKETDRDLQNTKEEVSSIDKNKIVDKFIKDNPVMPKPKAEFFSPSKVAKESLDSSSLMYSETLAKIYESQGNFPLAIEAYEKLSLSIPEKRVIFAQKIDLLKEKLNNLKQ